jgi:hypothetical protein
MVRRREWGEGVEFSNLYHTYIMKYFTKLKHHEIRVFSSNNPP